MRCLNDEGQQALQLAGHLQMAIQQWPSYRGLDQSFTVSPFIDPTGQPLCTGVSPNGAGSSGAAAWSRALLLSPAQALVPVLPARQIAAAQAARQFGWCREPALRALRQ